MPRFFVKSNQIANGTVSIVGEDARHIGRALRMAVGEEISVVEETGKVYLCKLAEFLPDAVLADIVAQKESEAESPCKILLFQALPKGDKLDTVIQKAVESGVFAVYPYESERCIVRAKPEAEAHKTERRQRIAQEAAKQCGREIIPQISPTISFQEMLKKARETDFPLFCYEGEGTESLGRLLSGKDLKGKSISIIVGSEGGFSAAEATLAAENGFLMTGLGKRILRTETASSFALACISLLAELS